MRWCVLLWQVPKRLPKRVRTPATMRLPKRLPKRLRECTLTVAASAFVAVGPTLTSAAPTYIATASISIATASTSMATASTPIACPHLHWYCLQPHCC